MSNTLFFSEPYFTNDSVLTKPIAQIVEADLNDFSLENQLNPSIVLKHLIYCSVGCFYDRFLYQNKFLSPKIEDKRFKFFQAIADEVQNFPIDVSCFHPSEIATAEFTDKISSVINEHFSDIFLAIDEYRIAEGDNILPMLFHQVVAFLGHKTLWEFYKRKENYCNRHPWESRSKYELAICKILDRPIATGDNGAVTLSSLYVRREYNYSAGINYSDSNRGGKDHIHLEDLLLNLAVSGRIEIPQANRKDIKLLLINGMPGQGKSSLCQKLANDYYKSDLAKITRDIIYIDFTILKGKRFNDDRSITLKNIKNHSGNFTDTLNELLISYCAELGVAPPILLDLKNKFIILDGLEELENDLIDDESTISLENWIANLVDRFDYSTKIIITTRTGYVDARILQNCMSDHFSSISLENLREQEQNELFRRYTNSLSIEGEFDIASIKKILDKKEFDDIVTHPFLLFQAVDFTVSEKRTGKFVEDSGFTTRLFDKIVDTIFNYRWKEGANIAPLKSLYKTDNRKRFKKELEELAIIMHRSGIDAISVDDIEDLQLFEQANYNHGLDKVKFLKIAFYFEESMEPINDSGEKAIYFQFHNVFIKNYLIARGYYRKLKEVLTSHSKNHYAFSKLFGTSPLPNATFEYIKAISKNKPFPRRSISALNTIFSSFLLKGYYLFYNKSKPVTGINEELNIFLAFLFFGQLLQNNSDRTGNWYMPTYEDVGTEEKCAISSSLIYKNNNKWDSEFEFMCGRFAYLLLSTIEANNRYFTIGNDSYTKLSNLISFTNFKFSNSRLSAVKFDGFNFTNAEFINCDLSGSVFIECNFQSTAFIDSCINRVKFDNCSFENTTFMNTTADYCLITIEQELEYDFFGENHSYGLDRFVDYYVATKRILEEE